MHVAVMSETETRALADLNLIREAFGGMPLDRIPPGQLGDFCDCPVHRALADLDFGIFYCDRDVLVAADIVAGRVASLFGVWAELVEPAKNINDRATTGMLKVAWPKSIRDFITAFDHTEFVYLIDAGMAPTKLRDILL